MSLITGYTDLQTNMADWLAKSNLTAAIPGFIQNWEEKFFRQPLNFGRWMEAALSATMASSVIPVPDDYLALKYAYLNTNPAQRLDRVSLNQLYGTYPRNMSPDLPRWIARDVTDFVFGPPPDSDYEVKGVYWAKPVSLRAFTGDAAAHWMIVNAPDIVLYGSLLQAQPYLRSDTRIAVWKQFHDEALSDYRELFKKEEGSGSPMQEVLA
jgi:hypothetical protein